MFVALYNTLRKGFLKNNNVIFSDQIYTSRSFYPEENSNPNLSETNRLYFCRYSVDFNNIWFRE